MVVICNSFGVSGMDGYKVELVLCRERLEELLEHMKRKLSAAEYAVMTLYAGGRSYKEIAKKLSISEKSVDNALQRARKKLNPVLN